MAQQVSSGSNHLRGVHLRCFWGPLTLVAKYSFCPSHFLSGLVVQKVAKLSRFHSNGAPSDSSKRNPGSEEPQDPKSLTLRLLTAHPRTWRTPTPQGTSEAIHVERPPPPPQKKKRKKEGTQKPRYMHAYIYVFEETPQKWCSSFIPFATNKGYLQQIVRQTQICKRQTPYCTHTHTKNKAFLGCPQIPH